MDLREVVFEYLNKPDAPRFYMGASMIGHPCDLYVWLNYRGFRGDSENPFAKDGEDHPGRVFGIYKMGHDIENVVQAALKEKGIMESDQVPVIEEPIRGHADGVLRIDGERTLLEIKSANKRRFDLFKKNGIEKTEIKYYVQMQVYMHLLLISKGVFLVVSKDSFHIHVEEVPYVRDVAIDSIKRAKNLSDAPEPRPGFEKNDPNCVFCEYRKYCHASMKVEIGKPACLNCYHFLCGVCGVHQVEIMHPERVCEQWKELHLKEEMPF